jgi:hypothetical protein
MQDESLHLPVITRSEEEKHSFRWQTTLQKYNHRSGSLFAGHRFYISPNIDLPPRKDMSKLIELGGGTCLGRLPRASGGASTNGSLIILANDAKDAKRFQRNKCEGVFKKEIVLDIIFAQIPLNIGNKGEYRLA